LERGRRLAFRGCIIWEAGVLYSGCSVAKKLNPG
jgi:hypothetical protein